MNVAHIKVNKNIQKRLDAFINSEVFRVKSEIAKSEYWKHHSSQLVSDVDSQGVKVSGESGFYIPPSSNLIMRFNSRVKNFRLSNIANLWSEVQKFFLGPRLMSYSSAFDAVMSGKVISDPDLSKYFVNHKDLGKIDGIFSNTSMLVNDYKTWAKYKVTPNIINSYYYLNLLRRYIAPKEIITSLEIGSGSGNFASILHQKLKVDRLVLVDLPETLAVAIPFLSNLFPNSKMILPHEVSNDFINSDFNFAFLTVDQTSHIPDNSIDLAINCHSFQEMKAEQIKDYFSLIQRVCKPLAFFFTANRVEKIPSNENPYTTLQSEPPNRFEDYPFSTQNKIYIREVSKLSRLVQLDAIEIRLEQVNK